MRRVALALSLFALAVPAVARADAPALQARLVACRTGADLVARTATFSGSMPAVPGTRRMGMRFDLLARRPPAPAFTPVRVAGLGVWQRSAPGRSGFIFSQRVQELAAPAAYRAVVRFRWYGASGRLLRSARRTTATCVQPDWRPDLRPGLFDATSGAQGDATYRLVVSNDGRTEAGPFDVGLEVDGVAQPPQRVADGLAAGAATTVAFVAPPCTSGSTLRFALDAQGEVDEHAESDDAFVAPCPFTAAAAP